MLSYFKDLHKTLPSFKNAYHIILVANVREKTMNFSDYNGTSVISEFLTLSQYEKIVDTLRTNGYEVSSYFDENEFILDCVVNDYFSTTGKQVIVINTAQKGTAIGRKSLIPAFCDLNGIWHTNSNAYAVSLTRNKYHCDSILKANSLPVTDEYLFSPNSGWFLNKKPVVGEKMIAKLNGETSSIGMTKDNIFTYEDAKDEFIKGLAEEYHQPIIVQTFVEGYEVEVPIIIDGNCREVVLPVGISVNDKKQLNETILDYTVRKNLEFDFYNFQQFNPDISEQLEECTKQVILLLGIEGFGRVDYRIDLNGNYYITDVAANPHLTKGMSFNYAFDENELDYKDMLEMLIAVTISRYTKKQKF